MAAPTNPAAAAEPTSTVAFASDTGWQTFAGDPGAALGGSQASLIAPAQRVCMSAFSPSPCPAGATVFNAPFSGWSANLAPIPGASWIQAPGVSGTTTGAELASYWFAKEFIIPGSPTDGVIFLSADDYAEIRVNGAFAGSVGSVVDIGLAGARVSLAPFDVTPFLKAGRNVIAVRAQNGPTWYSPFCGATCTYAQNPAGVVFGGSLSWAANQSDRLLANGSAIATEDEHGIRRTFTFNA